MNIQIVNPLTALEHIADPKERQIAQSQLVKTLHGQIDTVRKDLPIQSKNRSAIFDLALALDSYAITLRFNQKQDRDLARIAGALDKLDWTDEKLSAHSETLAAVTALVSDFEPAEAEAEQKNGAALNGHELNGHANGHAVLNGHDIADAIVLPNGAAESALNGGDVYAEEDAPSADDLMISELGGASSTFDAEATEDRIIDLTPEARDERLNDLLQVIADALKTPAQDELEIQPEEVLSTIADTAADTAEEDVAEEAAQETAQETQANTNREPLVNAASAARDIIALLSNGDWQQDGVNLDSQIAEFAESGQDEELYAALTKTQKVAQDVLANLTKHDADDSELLAVIGKNGESIAVVIPANRHDDLKRYASELEGNLVAYDAARGTLEEDSTADLEKIIVASLQESAESWIQHGGAPQLNAAQIKAAFANLPKGPKVVQSLSEIDGFIGDMHGKISDREHTFLRQLPYYAFENTVVHGMNLDPVTASEQRDHARTFQDSNDVMDYLKGLTFANTLNLNHLLALGARLGEKAIPVVEQTTEQTAEHTADEAITALAEEAVRDMVAEHQAVRELTPEQDMQLEQDIADLVDSGNIRTEQTETAVPTLDDIESLWHANNDQLKTDFTNGFMPVVLLTKAGKSEEQSLRNHMDEFQKRIPAIDAPDLSSDASMESYREAYAQLYRAHLSPIENRADKTKKLIETYVQNGAGQGSPGAEKSKQHLETLASFNALLNNAFSGHMTALAEASPAYARAESVLDDSRLTASLMKDDKSISQDQADAAVAIIKEKLRARPDAFKALAAIGIGVDATQRGVIWHATHPGRHKAFKALESALIHATTCARADTDIKNHENLPDAAEIFKTGRKNDDRALDKALSRLASIGVSFRPELLPASPAAAVKLAAQPVAKAKTTRAQDIVADAQPSSWVSQLLANADRSLAEADAVKVKTETPVVETEEVAQDSAPAIEAEAVIVDTAADQEVAADTTTIAQPDVEETVEPISLDDGLALTSPVAEETQETSADVEMPMVQAEVAQADTVQEDAPVIRPVPEDRLTEPKAKGTGFFARFRRKPAAQSAAAQPTAAPAVESNDPTQAPAFLREEIAAKTAAAASRPAQTDFVTRPVQPVTAETQPAKPKAEKFEPGPVPPFMLNRGQTQAAPKEKRAWFRGALSKLGNGVTNAIAAAGRPVERPLVTRMNEAFARMTAAYATAQQARKQRADDKREAKLIRQMEKEMAAAADADLQAAAPAPRKGQKIKAAAGFLANKYEKLSDGGKAFARATATMLKEKYPAIVLAGTSGAGFKIGSSVAVKTLASAFGIGTLATTAIGVGVMVAAGMTVGSLTARLMQSYDVGRQRGEDGQPKFTRGESLAYALRETGLSLVRKEDNHFVSTFRALGSFKQAYKQAKQAPKSERGRIPLVSRAWHAYKSMEPDTAKLFLSTVTGGLGAGLGFAAGMGFSQGADMAQEAKSAIDTVQAANVGISGIDDLWTSIQERLFGPTEHPPLLDPATFPQGRPEPLPRMSAEEFMRRANLDVRPIPGLDLTGTGLTTEQVLDLSIRPAEYPDTMRYEDLFNPDGTLRAPRSIEEIIFGPRLNVGPTVEAAAALEEQQRVAANTTALQSLTDALAATDTNTGKISAFTAYVTGSEHASTLSGNLNAYMNGLSAEHRALLAPMLERAQAGSFTQLNNLIDSISEGGVFRNGRFVDIRGLAPNRELALELRRALDTNLDSADFSQKGFRDAFALHEAHLANLEGRGTPPVRVSAAEPVIRVTHAIPEERPAFNLAAGQPLNLLEQQGIQPRNTFTRLRSGVSGLFNRIGENLDGRPQTHTAVADTDRWAGLRETNVQRPRVN